MCKDKIVLRFKKKFNGCAIKIKIYIDGLNSPLSEVAQIKKAEYYDLAKSSNGAKSALSAALTACK